METVVDEALGHVLGADAGAFLQRAHVEDALVGHATALERRVAAIAAAGPALPPRRAARAPALAHRNYRVYVVAQGISVVGTWMQNLGQAWLVLTLSGDPFVLGLAEVGQDAGERELFGAAEGGGEDPLQALESGEESPREEEGEELLSSIFGGVAGQHDAAAHLVDSAAAASTTPGALAFKTAPAPVAARARVPAVAALPVEPPEPLEWGGHTAASTFKPSQLSRLCREIGASTEQMDACADADDPKAEYMALLRPSRLQRRCAGLGTYSEAEMEACADAEAPQLAYIRLLLWRRGE